MMTDEELAAIRARAAAATPGPWRCWNGYELRVPHAEQPVVPDMAMSRIGPEPHIGVGLSSLRPRDDMRALRPDTEFVAHARDDVPALLAEVEHLRERVAALEAERDAASANVQRLLERDAAMRAIVERVATEIDDVTDWFCKRCISGCEKTATGLRMVHKSECLVIQARALLATTDGEGKG